MGMQDNEWFSVFSVKASDWPAGIGMQETGATLGTSPRNIQFIALNGIAPVRDFRGPLQHCKVSGHFPGMKGKNRTIIWTRGDQQCDVQNARLFCLLMSLFVTDVLSLSSYGVGDILRNLTFPSQCETFLAQISRERKIKFIFKA